MNPVTAVVLVILAIVAVLCAGYWRFAMSVTPSPRVRVGSDQAATEGRE